MKIAKLLPFIAIGLIASVLTFLIYSHDKDIDFFNSIDMTLKDYRFKIRKNLRPDDRVVIVAIDFKSVKEIGRWAWKRSVIAQLIDSLKEYEAKIVALDIVFAEQSEIKEDIILSKSIAKNRNVIPGYAFREEKITPSRAVISQLESSQVKLIKISEDADEKTLLQRPFVDFNIPLIGKGALDFGFFNTDSDPDGTVRRANLLMRYNDSIYPSLTLKALRHYAGNEIMLGIESFGLSFLRVGQISIPADESGRLVVNYYGKPGTIKTLSAVDVIKKRLDKEELKDKIVFVGPTELGIGDMRVTPVESVYPGVEIHATVASNMLRGHFILRDTRIIAIEMLCLFLLPLVLVLMLGLIRNSFWGLLAFLLTEFFYVSLNYFLFRNYSADMTMFYPLFATAISYIGSEAYRNLVVEKKNRYLKKAFSSYVSPELVSEIIKNPDRLVLGGEKKEVTILFSDIRGFTGISEKLAPDVLVSLLNDYLGPMTRIVLKHRGTLDKYIGDAIMAIYNAPLELEGHPAKACETALEMLNELKNVNNKFKENGLPFIDIGIGVHTGDAVIGNMGADMRFDYTAIGDTVNLASRLEGQNKYYGTHIILSESTAKKIGDKFVIREIDLLRVVGKEKPSAVYELLSEPSNIFKEKFSKALMLYRKREFDAALRIFSSLTEEFKDNVSNIYIDRCRKYLESPPSSDWDGSYVTTKK